MASQLQSGDQVLIRPLDRPEPTRVTLHERVGSGRAGTVWTLLEPDYSDYVAKIYFEPPADLELRLKAFLSRHLEEYWLPSAGGAFLSPLAAPWRLVDSVDGRPGAAIGLVLLKVSTDQYVGLDRYFGSQQAKRDLVNNLALSKTLWDVIEEVHDRGFVIGDLAASNIMVSGDRSGRLVIVDVDSFGYNGSIDVPPFKASHVTDNYRAPDARDTSTQRSDVFAAATLTCRLLMNDRNPFAGLTDNEDPTPQQNIDSGRCWLRDPNSVALPQRLSLSPGLQGLPDPLSRLMFAALSPQPTERPTAQDVVLAIRLVRTADGVCGHQRLAGAECPECPATPAKTPERSLAPVVDQQDAQASEEAAASDREENPDKREPWARQPTDAPRGRRLVLNVVLPVVVILTTILLIVLFAASQ